MIETAIGILERSSREERVRAFCDATSSGVVESISNY